MSAEQKPQPTDRPFRRWLFPGWAHAARVLGVVAVLLLLAYWFLDRVFNPVDLNHVLLINASDQNLNGLTLEMQGDEYSWSEKLRGCGAGRLSVTNIPHPYVTGNLLLRLDGAAVCSVPANPPGRYCGTLVLEYHGQQKYRWGWNEFPGPNRQQFLY